MIKIANFLEIALFAPSTQMTNITASWHCDERTQHSTHGNTAEVRRTKPLDRALYPMLGSKVDRNSASPLPPTSHLVEQHDPPVPANLERTDYSVRVTVALSDGEVDRWASVWNALLQIGTKWCVTM